MVAVIFNRGAGGSTDLERFLANSPRNQWQTNNNGAPATAARGIPLSNVEIVQFDAKANLGSTAAAWQLPCFFQDKLYEIPYGQPASSVPGSVVGIYDPNYTPDDPFQKPAAWRLVDLHTQGPASPYAEGFLGAIPVKNKLYFIPSFTIATDGVTQTSNPVFFVWDPALGDFADSAAWSQINNGPTAGGGTNKVPSIDWCGWGSACTDGNYVYFGSSADYKSGSPPHGTQVRYDTRLPFTSASSWEAITLHTGAHMLDTGCRGFQGIAFDGKYIWLAPSDNSQDNTAKVARFDTTKTDFSANSDLGWEFYDITTPGFFTNCTNSRGFNGMFYANDRWMVFVPWQDHSQVRHGWVTAVDTKHPTVRSGALSATGEAWFTFNLASINAAAIGYQGGAEIGGYWWLNPAFNGTICPPLARRDSTDLRMTSSAAWELQAMPTGSPWATYLAWDERQYLYTGPLLAFTIGTPTSGLVSRIRVPTMNPGESTQIYGRSTSAWSGTDGSITNGARQQAKAGFQQDVIGQMHAAGLIQSDVALQGPIGANAYFKAVGEGDCAAPNVGNSAGVTTVLKSFTIPASTLAVNGMYIEFWAEGVHAANADADKNVSVQYGPSGSTTLCATSGNVTNNNAVWRVRGWIMRSGAGTQEGGGEYLPTTGGTGGGYKRIAAPTKDETVAWVLQVIGGGTTASDVVLKSCGWTLHRGQN